MKKTDDSVVPKIVSTESIRPFQVLVPQHDLDDSNAGYWQLSSRIKKQCPTCRRVCNLIQCKNLRASGRMNTTGVK